MGRLLPALLAAGLLIGTALAEDQTLLGAELVVSNPGPEHRRKIVVYAKESDTDATLVGDPSAAGAVVTIELNGAAASSQTHLLPSGTSAVGNRSFWRGDFIKGFTYRDTTGENGAVERAFIRIRRGVARLKIWISSRTRPVSNVPPNLGTDGCVRFAIGDGDSYSIAFADGTVSNWGAARFKVARPTSQRTCLDAPTTTTTTSTSTTTSTIVVEPAPLVWAFGDSITGFYCPVLRNAHPEWNVECRHISGERTAGGLTRLTNALAEAPTPPSVVVIEEGVNDCVLAAQDFDLSSGSLVCNETGPLGPTTVATNLELMAEAVRAHGATPLVATTLHQCPVPSVDCMALPIDDPGFCPVRRCFFDHVCDVNALIETGATPAIPFQLDGAYFLDVLHPNAEGAAILAQRAADAIAAALQPSTTSSTSAP